MKSKRLNAADLQNPAYLAELLERGSWDDWKPLYRTLPGNAGLQACLAQVLATHPFMTAALWKALLVRMDDQWAKVALAKDPEFVP
jgi:hypothetical protein